MFNKEQLLLNSTNSTNLPKSKVNTNWGYKIF